MSIETVWFLLPELVVALAALVIYVAGTFIPQRHGWSWAAAAVLVFGLFALAAVYVSGPQAELATKVFGSVAPDHLAYFGRAVAMILGILMVLLTAGLQERSQSPEFFGTLLLVVVGMMVVSAAQDLILIFLALELISIPTYILLYLARRGEGKDLSTEESTVKYFFLSIFSSAILLYGLSFLFGAGETTSLPAIYAALTENPDQLQMQLPFAKIALLLIFVGLGFKLAAVPFHFYAPDVYQGTSNAAAGLLSVAPKFGGIIALTKIVSYSMPAVAEQAYNIAWLMAALTILIGNILALRQTNIRRLLAYSSVGHAGYMLLGITIALSGLVSTADGTFPDMLADPIGASLLYLTVYSFATLGIFATLSYLTRDGKQVSELNDLYGLSSTHPYSALALVIFLFSLAGIPPLIGFWGKFYIFYGALDLSLEAEVVRWNLTLAVIGAIGAAIAVGYYLRVMSAMYLQPRLDKPLQTQSELGAPLATGLCVLLVVVLGALPGTLFQQAETAGTAGRATVIETPVTPSTPDLVTTSQP